MELQESVYSIDFKANFKSDIALVGKILELTRTSYVSNTYLIEREIEHNQDIYIISSGTKLLAFFMVNFELVNRQETYYLGLSACSEDYKGKGLGKSLYLRFLDDCRTREKNENKKFMLWWTTGTPIVYYWFNKYVSKVQPDMDGAYDKEGENIAIAIVKEKFPEITVDKDHPFILRSVAANTTYSLNEKARLLVATEKLKMDVFQKFNVREENADRFLMIGYAPD